MNRPGLATRRAWLRQLAAWGAAPGSSSPPAAAAQGADERGATPGTDPVRRGRPLVFPRDHGAHPGARIEWWYATGWLQRQADPAPEGLIGFQITFFRSRTGLGEEMRSRWAPRQLLFAHAALTDVAAARHEHDVRLGRWTGQEMPGARVRASLLDADLAVHGWQLRRLDVPARWQADLQARGFALQLQMARTQPVLLQGEAGFSRKGPGDAQASHYLSEPQLAVTGRLQRGGRSLPVAGRAWLDQEWSDELLHPEAVGWDWIGMNLDDGSALTAFRLRRADGSVLWVGGSFRRSGQASAQDFPAHAVRFEPGRRWRSPGSGGDYPVEWAVHTPAGSFKVHALLDTQELDSRSSTGTVYWEGLSELQDSAGHRVGLGYLEMTGYAGRLLL